MCDITKVTSGSVVTYAANSVRAIRWFKIRFGRHTATFDTKMPEERKAAIALEEEARAFNPPLTFDEL